MLGLPPLTFLYIFLPSGDKYLADTMSILGSFSALSRLFTRLILGLSSAYPRLNEGWLKYFNSLYFLLTDADS